MADELAGQGIPTAFGSLLLPAGSQQAAVRAGELKRLQADLGRIQAKLSNPEFMAKAPAEVVAKEEQKAFELKAAIGRLAGS